MHASVVEGFIAMSLSVGKNMVSFLILKLSESRLKRKPRLMLRLQSLRSLESLGRSLREYNVYTTSLVIVPIKTVHFLMMEQGNYLNVRITREVSVPEEIHVL